VTADLRPVRAGGRLLRSYRRLMWAYPRWYRRERGAELLTTLLDAAAPGQQRPTSTDVRDLVGGGIRTRMRPPRTAIARAVAVQVALYVAVLGAAAGILMSGYPGPPAEAEAIAAAMVAVPQPPRNLPGPVLECDMLCADPVPGDDVTAFRRTWDYTDSVHIMYRPPPDQVSTVVTQARQRLAGAGWRVTPLRVQNDGFVSFEASKGRLALMVTGQTAQNGDGSLGIGVTKSRSTGAVLWLVGGAVAGLLTGWLLAAWALQRFRRHRDLRRRAVTVLAGPYLVLGTLFVFGVLRMALVVAVFDRAEARNLKAPLFLLPDPATTYWVLPASVALSALAALVACAVPGRARQPAAAGPVRV
jgi:hypothetical protein